MMGSNVALPAAVFCLGIHLERVSSIRQVRTTHNEKRHRQLFDALLCFGIPIIYMALRKYCPLHVFHSLTLPKKITSCRDIDSISSKISAAVQLSMFPLLLHSSYGFHPCFFLLDHAYSQVCTLELIRPRHH